MTETTEPMMDPENMAEHIGSFVEQLDRSTSEPLDISYECRRVVICGMGGSAISGDILADFSYGSADVPISVVRGVQMPSWAGEGTLALVTSYSGNTKETLELYAQAREAGCHVIGISSGGALEEACDEDGFMHARLPSGVQPRSAIGHILGCQANILESLGVSPCRSAVREALPALREFRDSMSSDGDENPARLLALRLKDRIPVIYSYPHMTSSALRWKNQFNENSKMIAFHGTIPEFNHNEIEGWMQGGNDKPCLPVFLYDTDAPDMLRHMMNASLEILREKGLEVEVVEIGGKDALEKNLKSIMYGDYTSLYLAYLNLVDPSPVKSISSLKDRIKAALARHAEEKAARRAAKEEERKAAVEDTAPKPAKKEAAAPRKKKGKKQSE